MYKKNDKYTLSLAAASYKKKKVISRDVYEKQQLITESLQKTSQYLVVETDVKLILSKIAETFGKAIGAKYVNFWKFTPDKKGVYITAAYGMQKQYAVHSKEDPIELGTAWIGRAMKTGKIWSTSDAQKDPELPRSWLPAVKKQNYHGLLCMPLKRNNIVTGGMCIYYKNIHKFDYFEMSLAGIVANQAATAVANANLFDDLTAEKNKFQSTVQSLKDGLIIYDINDRVSFMNYKAEEFLWLSAKEVIGKKINLKAKQKNVYWKNIYNIKNLVQIDYTTKEYVADGPKKIVLEVTYVPVRDKYEKVGAMQVLRDITKEKEVEHLKSNFVSVASHQLRTPLSGMKWALDTLSRGEVGELNKEQKELIDRTYRSNEQLIALVRDLLDVSRIEEGKFGYDFVLDDLVKLVEEIYKDYNNIAENCDIKLVFNKPKIKMPPISFDTKKLDIAIRNVIDNALKYTLPGGRVEITFHLENKNKFLFLLIKDNGVGIPKEDHQHIFIKFFRAKNVVKLQTEGSGLGLYIAKEIAEKHNVLLTFESKENKGSTFYFQFPLNSDKMPKGKIEGIKI